MSKLFNGAIAGFLVSTLGLSSGTANAAPVTASVTVKVRVLKQITVTKTSDLDFGTIAAGTAASIVSVSTSGGRTCGLGVTCTGTVSSANFNISGTNNTVLNISGDTSVTLANGTGGTMAAVLTRSASTLTLTNSGPVGGSFQVGGTLSIAANQADGAYSGTFNVTVDYQ